MPATKKWIANSFATVLGSSILLALGCSHTSQMAAILGVELTTSTPNIETFSVVPSGQSAALSWTCTGNAGIVMIRKNDTEFPTSITHNELVATISISTHSGSYTDQTVTPDATTYYTLFIGTDNAVYSAKTATASVSISKAPLPASVCISQFSATAENSGIILAYTASADVKQIMIRRSANENPSTTQSAVLVATVDVTSAHTGTYLDTSILARTPYYYSIFAADASGRFTDSPVTASVTSKPDPAGQFTATAIQPTGYIFRWTNPTLQDGDQVIVRESTANIPLSIDDGASTYTGTANTCAILDFNADGYAATHNYSVFIKTAGGAISAPLTYSFYQPAKLPYLQPGDRSQTGEITFLIIPPGNLSAYKKWTLVINAQATPQSTTDGTVIYSGLPDVGHIATADITGLDISKKYYSRLFVVDRNDHIVTYVNRPQELEFVGYPSFPKLSNLTATATNTDVTLHFTVPPYPVKKLMITRQIKTDTSRGSLVVVSSTAPYENLTSIVDSDTILPNTDYTYMVYTLGDYDSTGVDLPSISDGQQLNVATAP